VRLDVRRRHWHREVEGRVPATSDLPGLPPGFWSVAWDPRPLRLRLLRNSKTLLQIVLEPKGANNILRFQLPDFEFRNSLFLIKPGNDEVGGHG